MEGKGTVGKRGGVTPSKADLAALWRPQRDPRGRSNIGIPVSTVYHHHPSYRQYPLHPWCLQYP